MQALLLESIWLDMQVADASAISQSYREREYKCHMHMLSVGSHFKRGTKSQTQWGGMSSNVFTSRGLAWAASTDALYNNGDGNNKSLRGMFQRSRTITKIREYLGQTSSYT